MSIMPEIDPGVVDRYRKVAALAVRGGTQGERDTAQAILRRMEVEYPGIQAVAAQQAAPPPGAGHHPFSGGMPGGAPWDWAGGGVGGGDVWTFLNQAAGVAAQAFEDWQRRDKLTGLVALARPVAKRGTGGNIMFGVVLTPQLAKQIMLAVEGDSTNITPEGAQRVADAISARINDIVRGALLGDLD